MSAENEIKKLMSWAQLGKIVFAMVAALILAGWSASHYLDQFAKKDDVTEHNARVEKLEGQQQIILDELREIRRLVLGLNHSQFNHNR